MPERAKSAGDEPDLTTTLDLERTYISYEQSMMTWIRTAITLITFGFTIYKFFQLELPGRAEKSHLVGPREFALILVALGLISLAMATLEHRRCQQLIKKQWPDAPWSLALWLAAMISILGTIAFLLMIFRQ
jgi:putative membrane protein